MQTTSSSKLFATADYKEKQADEELALEDDFNDELFLDATPLSADAEEACEVAFEAELGDQEIVLEADSDAAAEEDDNDKEKGNYTKPYFKNNEMDSLLESYLSDFSKSTSIASFPEGPSARYSPKKPEQVVFATFAPKSILPDSSFVLDIWAYLPDQYSFITTAAQELGRDKNLGQKTGVPIDRGTILSIRIDIKGFKVPDPVDSIVWDGVPTNASFIINVPADTAIGNYPGKAVISYQGLAIAKMVFLIVVDTANRHDYTDYSSKTIYPKTAFASYASENREAVLSRIQGMKKVAPELDIFVDVFSLRSGQNWIEKLQEHVPTKDTFYLFWSQPAARSEWVEREWRLALLRRGLDYIDPVPLEEPDRAPPPPELSKLHFSDPDMMHIEYERLKKKYRDRE
ncbi:MAG: toll/interleukin-1 receptor domain-containing protein [Proteobacteria bacterium]|nr:toll/interleukin-1 receptor domain-containing protein [Pseudomonadota bacterium]MBU2454165.1 toll/interleukin-1 receptor domain-containing protein [Pseudomonadota bacterium]